MIFKSQSFAVALFDLNTGASPAGGRGAMPPRFFSCPPHGIFLGGRSCCYWAEKTLKFAISARKSLGISAETNFFFGDHLLLVGKFGISARKSLRISAKTSFFFGDHLLLVGKFGISARKIRRKPLPPDLAKLATPLFEYNHKHLHQLIIHDLLRE